jgi:hypothetical protein
MTVDEFEGLTSEEMLDLLANLTYDLWESINDPDNDVPNYDVAKVITRMMTYGILKYRNVAAYFTADFEHSSIEETQIYAREIASYIDEFGDRTPLPVYREFADWVDTTEQVKVERLRQANKSRTSLFEDIEDFLAAHKAFD